MTGCASCPVCLVFRWCNERVSRNMSLLSKGRDGRLFPSRIIRRAGRPSRGSRGLFPGTTARLAVGLLPCLLLVVGTTRFNPTDAATDELLIFHEQHRIRLPLVSIEGHSYVPILDVLHLLDLAYSESGSAGYLRIFAGNDVVELNRNQPRVRLNRSSIGLAAPVLFHGGRWLTPRGFVPDVLNRVLKPAIRVSPSGNRWLTGGRDFVRINLTARTTDEASRLVVSLVNAGEIQVRGEDRRILFLLGADPVDPPGAEVTSYRDERIGDVSFEETAGSSRLVVSLADESVQARLTRLAGQNAYLVDAFRRTVEAPSAAREPKSFVRWTSRPEATGWRRITIDPGHGGTDRGVVVREGVYEKDVTLSIARKLRWVLESRLGVETVLSRDQDRSLSLEDRAREANRGRSDLFLSIHLGNGTSPTASASYVYLAKLPPGEALAQDRGEEAAFELVRWDRAQATVLHRSFRLAEILQEAINEHFNGGDPLSLRHAPLRLLSSLAMPAVLLELGNVKQDEFRETVLTEPFQNGVAIAVLSALQQFRPIDEAAMAGREAP